MATANDSVAVTPGSGVNVATQLIGGVEYQVMITANSAGQLLGDSPTYTFWSGNISAAANKVYAHIYNGAGSGKIVKVRKVFVQPSQAAVTGVSQQWKFSKTNALGTTGATAVTLRAHDSADPALPAQIAAQHSFTAGGADVFTYFEIGLNPEETLPAVGLMPYFNLMPTDGDYTSDVVLREGEGFKVTNVTGLTYTYSVVVVVSVE